MSSPREAIAEPLHVAPPARLFDVAGPSLVAISFSLLVLRWPLAAVAAGGLFLGACAVALVWSRWTLAHDHPRLAGAVAGCAVPVAVGAVAAFTTLATGTEALVIAALSIACAPLAGAAAPSEDRGRTSDFALTLVVCAPAVFPLASVARPDALWPVLIAAVPFAVAVRTALRGVAIGERRHSAVIESLILRAANLSRGRSGQLIAVDRADPGARALADELHRWRVALIKAQSTAEVTAPKLVESSAALQSALSTDQRAAGSWGDALQRFCAGAEKQKDASEEISAQLAEVGQLTQTVDAATRQDERGAVAFFAAMDELTRHSEVVADSVRDLNERVRRVGTIIQSISGIADRADLLAVNAELEANRATDVERAFSLLAGEMRRMAEQVIQSAQSISTDIDAVVRVSTAATSAANAAVVTTQESARLGRELTACLAQLLEMSQDTARGVGEVREQLADARRASSRLLSKGASLLRVDFQASAVVGRLETVTAEIKSLGNWLAGDTRA